MGRVFTRVVKHSQMKSEYALVPYVPIATLNESFFCQAVWPNDEPCDYPAAVHCPTYGGWFWDAHAEDEVWHSHTGRRLLTRCNFVL